jgi:DNA-binding NarL/FixJ family response regulator
MSIKVAIVEDNTVFRQGLKHLLGFSADVVCVGDYEDGKSFFEHLSFIKPDVVLMDIDLPGMSGLDCTAYLKSQSNYQAIQIIMLTVLEANEKIMDAIMAGASGYLLKNSSAEQILDAIRQVMTGGSPMSSSIARKVFGFIKTHQKTPVEKINLNKRENEVLSGLVEGLSYKMIGEKYFISTDTVRTYIRSIYEKLQVHSRSEAVAKALKNNWR